MGKSIDDFLQQWSRRLRNPVADYIILWFSAFSTVPVYPYSLHTKLLEIWQDDEGLPLQTVYSTIKRLEEDGMIEASAEIVEGRAQKIIQATPLGFEALKLMKASFVELTHTLSQYYEV